MSQTLASARLIGTSLLIASLLFCGSTIAIAVDLPGTDKAAEDQPTGDSGPSVRVITDQRYSPEAGKYGYCDLYRPEVPARLDDYPVVVVIHGGGWTGGDKRDFAMYGRAIARAGMVAICINYRLAPKSQFPAQLDDVRQALCWTRQQQKKLSLDLERLGIFGYSAGGHLALLAATIADEPMSDQTLASNWDADDPRWVKIPKIRAVCAGGPPCDFQLYADDNTTLAYFLGGSKRQRPEIYRVASPLTHVSPSDPPSKIIHGEVDYIVPIKGSRTFHQRQQQSNLDASLDVLAGNGHLLSFINPRTRQLMVNFFTLHLQPVRAGDAE